MILPTTIKNILEILARQKINTYYKKCEIL